jgi:uncharacterized protein YkwD
MRSSIARRLAKLALLPVALFGAVAVASPAHAAAPTTVQLQSDILAGTNAQRARHGCGTLRLDANISRAARNHSAFMATTGTFSHTGSGNSSFVTRIRAQGYTAPLSENIAWGYRTGADVVTAWMNSAGHRANILNCSAKSVGIGAVYAANGNPYVTEDFGSK